ncbi:hypothetical protein CTA1_1888 [Colletotrichum tanaceti]|uniref:Uncharacterized protein n=1 Tax=Colletotrichum tanaceti TaxID=1306861 RepID=A0A4U6XDA3_9PEZI|nr:hypothetical protein CTA1_1888 [Colletotrichum tanaceti]
MPGKKKKKKKKKKKEKKDQKSTGNQTDRACSRFAADGEVGRKYICCWLHYESMLRVYLSEGIRRLFK